MTSTQLTPAIRVQGLEKSYRQVRVLRGVDLDVDLWVALGWCLGILVIAYALAMAAFRRRIA